jgi:hypothetical protein
MNIQDFRRLALSLPGAEESSHMGAADFRVGNRIFATLAAAKLGYGNVMITPEQQAAFVEELPAIFIPVTGGWRRNTRQPRRSQRRCRLRCPANRPQTPRREKRKDRHETSGRKIKSKAQARSKIKPRQNETCAFETSVEKIIPRMWPDGQKQ